MSDPAHTITDVAAFPFQARFDDGSVEEPSYGMTLRDWFAGHGDQPGVSEIVSMAGHTSDGFWVFREGVEKVNFNEWWNSLPLSERLALSARVRFAQADAMLAARVQS